MKPALIFPTNFPKIRTDNKQTDKIKLFGICGSRLGSPLFQGAIIFFFKIIISTILAYSDPTSDPDSVIDIVIETTVIGLEPP